MIPVDMIAKNPQPFKCALDGCFLHLKFAFAFLMLDIPAREKFSVFPDGLV